MIKIKPMAFRDFIKLSQEDQTEYLQTLIWRYGATIHNLCDLFGIGKNHYRFYIERRGINLEYERSNRYKRCRSSKAWKEFIAPLKNQAPQKPGSIREDCFALIPGEDPQCSALKKLYCRTQECEFYKPKKARKEHD